MKHRKTKILSIVAINLLAFSVFAGDWGMYLGVGNAQNQYKGTKNDYAIFPDITYRINRDEKNEDKLISYDLVIQSYNIGYDAKNSEIFTGMKKRKRSVDLGAQVIINNKIAPIIVEATKDVYGSKGFEAMVKVRANIPDKDLAIHPVAGARFKSSKVVDYYYGVRESEATDSRMAYIGKSAIIPFVGLELATEITKNITLNANISYQFRSSKVKNSPLTDNKKYDIGWNIGLIYWF